MKKPSVHWGRFTAVIEVSPTGPSQQRMPAPSFKRQLETSSTLNIGSFRGYDSSARYAANLDSPTQKRKDKKKTTCIFSKKKKFFFVRCAKELWRRKTSDACITHVTVWEGRRGRPVWRGGIEWLIPTSTQPWPSSEPCQVEIKRFSPSTNELCKREKKNLKSILGSSPKLVTSLCMTHHRKVTVGGGVCGKGGER